MITDEVIKEIYKNYNRQGRKPEELNIDHFIRLLTDTHLIYTDDDELVIDDLEESNPFRRFLIRSLTGILEFDRHVAFVFIDHILFFNKTTGAMRVHFKVAKQRSLLDKLFGKH